MDKFLLLLLGAILTWLGSILGRWQQDRQRNKVEAEQALLRWLDLQNTIARKLHILSDQLSRKPRSSDKLSPVLDELDGLMDDVSNLINAANRSYLYDRNSNRSTAVQELTKRYEGLAEGVRILSDHYAVRLRHLRDIEASERVLKEIQWTDQGQPKNETIPDMEAFFQKLKDAQAESRAYLDADGPNLTVNIDELSEVAEKAFLDTSKIRQNILEDRSKG